MGLVQPQGEGVGVRAERTFGPSRHRHLVDNMEVSHNQSMGISRLVESLTLEDSQKNGTSHCSSESRFGTRYESQSTDTSALPTRRPSTLSRDSHRAANVPPVKNPAMMAFQGSSFCLYPLTAQSKLENRPPQIPKFPPKTGARALMALKEPASRSPRGDARDPLIPCQIYRDGRWGNGQGLTIGYVTT
jgi:hypothetical protein